MTALIIENAGYFRERNKEMNQMKWIEQIRVRSSVSALQDAMPSLHKRVKEIDISARGAEVFFMQHALYQGDLAIVLVWINETKPRKTHEGMMVAERLLQLGPIDHAVWIPAENMPGV
jgi:hypothetical protein